MSYLQKQRELEFHMERTRESAAMVLRSIINNPALEPAQQLKLLQVLSTKHFDIAHFIQATIESGIQQGVVELEKISNSRS